MTTLVAGGHLLLEDVPGVGKTTLAEALARVCGLRLARVQFTADLMPADVPGVQIFTPASGEFQFRPGPLFHELVLADELNRAPPRTQSALLEAMAQRAGHAWTARTHLPRPFAVVATQNPSTSPAPTRCPTSQLDRFLLRLRSGTLAGGGGGAADHPRARRAGALAPGGLDPEKSCRCRRARRRPRGPGRSPTTSWRWPGRPGAPGGWSAAPRPAPPSLVSAAARHARCGRRATSSSPGTWATLRAHAGPPGGAARARCRGWPRARRPARCSSRCWPACPRRDERATPSGCCAPGAASGAAAAPRVTRAGRTYLVLCFGVGLGALNTGNNLLYLVLGLQLR